MEQLDITLRAPEPGDLDTLYLWENDPQLWPFGDAAAPLSRHMLAQYLDSYSGDIGRDGQLRLIVVERSSGKPVGIADLFDYHARDRRAGVGIFIDEAYRGRHYALQTLAWLSVYCPTHLGLHQLWAAVSADNRPSRRLFEAAGYKTCGRLRSWLRTGRRYSDAVIYQRLFE